MLSYLCVFFSRLVSRAVRWYRLPVIYLSSLDLLEMGNWNWKLDFLLVTCIPQFSQEDLSKSSRV